MYAAYICGAAVSDAERDLVLFLELGTVQSHFVGAVKQVAFVASIIIFIAAAINQKVRSEPTASIIGGCELY